MVVDAVIMVEVDGEAGQETLPFTQAEFCAGDSLPRSQRYLIDCFADW